MSKEKKCFKISLFLSLMLLFFSEGSPIYCKNLILTLLINNLGYILLFIADIIALITIKKSQLTINLKINKVIIAFIVGYLFIDLISLAFARNPDYMIEKYIIYAKLLYYILSIWLIIRTSKITRQEAISLSLLAIGSSYLLDIVALIILGYLKLLPYERKVTVHVNYNTFAEMLQYSIVAMLFYCFLMIRKSEKKKIWIFNIYIISISGTVLSYLSGSRRAYVLVFALEVIIGVYLIIRTNHGKLKMLFIIILSLLIMNNVMINSGVVFDNLVDGKYTITKNNTQHINGNKNNGNKNNGSEIKLEDRQKTTFAKDEALVSRAAIWNIAKNKIVEMDIKSIIIGNGGSYGWDVYEEYNNAEVNQLYKDAKLSQKTAKWMSPHSMWFKELLEGGVIKLIVIIGLSLYVLYKIIELLKKNELEYAFFLICWFMIYYAQTFLGGINGLIGEVGFMIGILFIFIIGMLEENKYE